MKKYNELFDHTLLKAEATDRDIKRLCEEAMANEFASVCVQPCWVPLCKALMKNSSVKVASVIGFPLGGDFSPVKTQSIKTLVQHGCDEFDMVMNIGIFKSQKYSIVLEEMKALVGAAGENTTKIIVESGLLTDEEIHAATELVAESGANFIKTSTGYTKIGATKEAVQIMKKSIGSGDLQIKASGGIRTAQDVKNFLELGVSRFGTSGTMNILTQLKEG